jgi:GNAT superfamily N-acetyltransferase
VPLTRRAGSVKLAAGLGLGPADSAAQPLNDDIQIVPLSRTPRDILRFLRVSYRVYDDDPHWVAPLLIERKAVFADSNPFFQHAEMRLWVASRQGQDAGRIAGIIDRNHDLTLQKATAFFGFFECVDDERVSHELFQTVGRWAKQKGFDRLLGPMNPSTNDECGLLVDGFGSPPVFMMTYNPAYYARLIEDQAFGKAKDLLALHIDLAGLPLDRLSRIAAKAQMRNPGLELRPVRRRTLRADVEMIKLVYNSAWQHNWGFVPMTEAEVDFMAAQLRPLFMEGLCWLAETGGEPVGLLLAMPDYNLALKPLRGRLLTPKALGLIPYWLGIRRPALARVLTLGVKEEHRGRGIEAALLIEALKVGFAKGFREAEASWILEDNIMMRRLLEAVGARRYKTYRLYEKVLEPLGTGSRASPPMARAQRP